MLPLLDSGPLLVGSLSQTLPEDISAVGTVRWASRRRGCQSCEWLWSAWLISNLSPAEQKSRGWLGEGGWTVLFFFLRISKFVNLLNFMFWITENEDWASQKQN